MAPLQQCLIQDFFKFPFSVFEGDNIRRSLIRTAGFGRIVSVERKKEKKKFFKG